MILEQNYRKVAQYTQKAFKLYSRRYFANLMLQILQKRQNIRQLQKFQSQINRNSNYSQKQSQIDVQNSWAQKQLQKDNLFSKTMKNIDTFQTLDRQNLFTDISYLNYGDMVFLEIYNSGMNSSDKSQRLRVYSQLQILKYRRLSYLSNEILTQKRCAFKIINPYDLDNRGYLTANSLFCLKSIFCNKFINLSNKIKISEFFGYDACMSSTMTKECFLQLKGVQPKQKRILTYEPIGIKLSSMYLRAEGLQISCNIQGSVFYFCKIPLSIKDLQPELVKIKSVSLQKYLSSSQVQINKLMNKKTYLNVSIQDQNGFPIKENQLVLATLDFNKIIQSEVNFESQKEQTMRNIWILDPALKNGAANKQQIKLIHACSNKGMIVKNDKTLRLTNNHNDTSYFNLTKHTETPMNKNEQIYDGQTQQTYRQGEAVDYFNRQHLQSGQNQTQPRVFELFYQQSNVMVLKNRQEIDKFYLGICEIQSLGHYKVQESRKIQFQIQKIDSNQSQLIQQLMEIEIVLKQSYLFIQKIGFILDQRSQSLRFCVQEIKKYNHMIINHRNVMNLILKRIKSYLESKHESWISRKKMQNFIKQLKIFQILICISKIINLKISKKKHLNQIQEIQDKSKQNFNLDEIKLKIAQTPFELCQKYFQKLQIDIFDTLYKLTVGNEKCSNTIVKEASFFNKLLMYYPQKIGKIIQQAIKNLSIFTTKASNNDCNELFQWAKLLQTITQENILVQKTYIDIISQVAIDPCDRGIIPYQNKLRQLLFNQRNKKKLMPRFGMQGDKPTITFQTSSLGQFLISNPNLYKMQAVSSNNACFYIEQFFIVYFQQEGKNKKKDEYIQYITSLIQLARNLTKDRNKKLLKVVQDYGLNQIHINHCLSSRKLGLGLKMQYLLLYSSLFVDQDPFLCFQRRQSKCHVWSKIDEYNLQSKTSLVFKQYTDITTAIQKFKQFDNNIIPFLETYLIQSKISLSNIFNNLKKEQIQALKKSISSQMSSFKIMVRFTYQAMNFGYLNLHYIKKFTFFIISHYQSFCKLFQVIEFSRIRQNGSDCCTDNCLQKNSGILNQILKIVELNEKIWREINCLNILKLFQKNYNENKRSMTSFQFRSHCWKLLNNEIPLIQVQQVNQNNFKNFYNNLKKKTTGKNMFYEQYLQENNLQQKSNEEYDKQIGIFLLKMLITHSQTSHKSSYKKLITQVQTRQKRNIQVYEQLNSLLILNGKKQEMIYRDYSGRVTGKILNVIKIYQLMNRIKGSQYQLTEDAQDQKRKKEKVVELNNLINKIRREMLQVKEEDVRLLNKFQQIIEKLNIDVILMELLVFSHKPAYLQCISNLYKFLIELIQNNHQNKLKLSNNFHVFMSNLRIEKCPLLLSELYLVLPQKHQLSYIQQLFDKIHSSTVGEDNLVKQSALQTVYLIIRKVKQQGLLGKINSQLAFQIFRQNDYASLLTIGTNLSSQYVNVLCELAANSTFVYEKIRKIYPKTLLRTIIYQQHKYSQRSVLLKLFYYFHIHGNETLENHQVQDIIQNLIFPEVKHLPSVCQYLALENLEWKQNPLIIKPQKQQRKASEEEEQIVVSLKNKFEDLILYEQTAIQPSQQEKYWNFIYNTEDQSQMSLINFTILLLKIQSPQNTQKMGISRRLFKSSIYQNFIKYLTELCQFLKEAFSKNSNQYQRKIINKLQQILIIYDQMNQMCQKTMYLNITQPDKHFLKQFFGDISDIIIRESISYSQIICCADVSNQQIKRKRSGQNIQRMVLEEEFVGFLQRLKIHVCNVKQFTQMVTQTKVTNFFNIYRCDKVRKINILKFLEKLFQYLQSIKNQDINSCNQNNQIKDRQTNNQGQLRRFRTDHFNFVDSINQNGLIQPHFKTYIRKYQIMLKIILSEGWKCQNQRNLQKVFQNLSSQSFKFKQNIIAQKAYKQKYYFQKKYTRNRQQITSNGTLQTNNTSKILLYHYLQKWCSGSENQNQKQSFSPNQQISKFSNNIIQIHSRYDHVQKTFSRIILWILKQINNQKILFVQTTENILIQYVRQGLQRNKNYGSITLNEILLALITNLNQGYLDKLKKENSLRRHHSYFNLRQKKIKSIDMGNEIKKYRSLVLVVYQQIFRNLDSEINQLLNFNFQYSIYSFLGQNKYFQIFVPLIFKSKLEIIKYGLIHKLVQQKYYSRIENCFIMIISLWAGRKYQFSDTNWYQILTNIVRIFEKYIQNIKKIAQSLSNNNQYVQRFTLLINHCCIMRFKTSNVNSLIQIRLLNLLSQFHVKLYLQNQKQAVGNILNGLNYQLLARSVQLTYNQSIQPKLNQFQNQIWCQFDPNNCKKCTFQVCNEDKITQNDQYIMQIFVSFLILIQLSISLNKKGYFRKALRNSSYSIFQNFQRNLKYSKIYLKKQNLPQLNYIYFYKRFIGIVYLYSEEMSLVTLHFKIPYLQKYCNNAVKQELLYHFKRLKQIRVQKRIQIFSKYFEAQLQQRKLYQRVWYLPFMLAYKELIQKFVVAVVFSHLFVLVYPTWGISEQVYYPFTILFIFIKINFTITQYNKACNIISIIYQKQNLSFKQKLRIFLSQNFVLNLALAILYLTSFFIPEICGVIAVGEVYNIKYVNKVSLLVIKALFSCLLYLTAAFGCVAVLFGILEFQMDSKRDSLSVIIQAFKEFYTFAVSHMKVANQYQYSLSKQSPISFAVYALLIIILFYKNLTYFLDELKSQSDKQLDTQKVCLICQGKNIDFEKRGSNFEQHTKLKHNLWHYLYFFIYLRKKSKSKQKQSLKSIQSYVLKQIQQDKYNFLKIKKFQ